MFKQEYKKLIIWGTTAFAVIVASVLFFFFIFRLSAFGTLLGKIIGILQPIIYGLVIGYLLTPIMNFWNKRICDGLEGYMKEDKYRRGTAKGLSIFISLLMAFLIIAALLGLVIPKLVDSIKGIIASFPTYMNTMQTWIEMLFREYPEIFDIPEENYSQILDAVQKWISTDLLSSMNTLLGNITTIVINIFNHFFNLLIGIIVSIYVLSSKEKFAGQGKKVLYAIFKPQIANNIVMIMRQSNRIFGGFISGKLLDSLIIGIICYIGLYFMNIPYKELVSVIVGVTNVIPFFGPYIGAIPSAFLILLVSPKHCIYFIIFILVLQQIDGNIIGPKILGNSTGLSAFWVVFAILLGGGLFGFIGMIMGVPTFAVIYYLIKTFVETRLKKKELPTESQTYSEVNYIIIEGKELIFLEKEKGKKIELRKKKK